MKFRNLALLWPVLSMIACQTATHSSAVSSSNSPVETYLFALNVNAEEFCLYRANIASDSIYHGKKVEIYREARSVSETAFTAAALKSALNELDGALVSVATEVTYQLSADISMRKRFEKQSNLERIINSETIPDIQYPNEHRSVVSPMHKTEVNYLLQYLTKKNISTSMACPFTHPLVDSFQD